MDCKKSLFQLDASATYLNCAFMSPQLKIVEEAGIEGLKRKRKPYQISGTSFFDETEQLRKEYAKLINAEDPKRIVVIPSVSYGMANVAKNLPLSNGDNIIVVGEQFPSNVYPWTSVASSKGAEIITITPPSSTDRGKIWNKKILKAINSRTKLVALGNVHWADGTLFNLKPIREKTSDVGAWLAIDGTQSVGALPFYVSEIQPDALVCAGYKWLMGPYSIGLAYYGPSLNEGSPIEENWINRNESEDFSNLVNYNENYQPGALRYEVGEHSNFILIPMMLEAIKQINKWGPDQVQNYCEKLVAEPITLLTEAGFMIEDINFRSSHLFGIRLGKHHDMDKIKSALHEKNILVSFRGNSIRVSPNVYNSTGDLTQLTEALLT
jgi:selenocysteine lyase/cysteine desulfurase